jgi:anaerobic selenocysteine-containing dehydrogenase
VTVREGVVARITPDTTAPFGRRPCLRGYSQIQRLYATDRLRYPMKRAGERGEGKWERIGWDEAIEAIAAHWKEILALNDSHAIAFYGGSPGARLLSLATTRLAMIMQASSFDMSADWAIYHGLHQVYGAASASTMSAPGNEPFEDDIANAKHIFLWGNNLSEAYLQRWRYVVQAQRNGSKLISIDPSETTTALRSDKWYRLRPASDTALILAMCNTIVAEGLQDEDYLAKLTVGPFLVKDADGSFLRMSDLGVKPTEGPLDPMTGQASLIDPAVVWDPISKTAAPAGTQGIVPALTGSFVISAADVAIVEGPAAAPDESGAPGTGEASESSATTDATDAVDATDTTASEGAAGTAAETAAPGTPGAAAAPDAPRPAETFKVQTAYQLLVEHLKGYTPEKMAETVDMDPAEIVELARMAADGPVTHMFGLGLQAYHNGLQYGVALGTLLAITGQTGKPGAGIGATAYDFPMNAMWLFPTFTFTNSISVLDVAEVIRTGKYAGNPYPPIKSIFVHGGGLVGGIVNMNSMIEDVFKKQDFIVCVDVAFSDTAQWADILLPGTLCFEAEDVYISPMNYVVQHYGKLIDPLYECKTQSEISRLVGTAMGFGDLFAFSDEEALSELLAAEPLVSLGIDLAALRKQGDIRYAPPSLAGAAGSFPTPSGKAEFYIENLSPRIMNGVAATTAQSSPDKNHLAYFYEPLEAWPGSAALKEYPFILTSVRARNRWHSSNFNVPWLNELEPEPTLFINPDDAASLGLKDGDYAEAYNARGSAVAKLCVSAGMRPGVLSYPKGWQSHQYKSGNFSTLTHSMYDPLAMNSSFFDCAVGLRKWEV